MSWKDSLNITGGFVFSEEIDEHFIALGFKTEVMKPDFSEDDTDYDKIKTIGRPALTLVTNVLEGGGYHRVYMNQTEVFYEKETSFDTLHYNTHIPFHSPPKNAEDVEVILDKLTSED